MNRRPECVNDADRGLSALALLEGVLADNKINRDAVFDTTRLDDLMVGMTYLARSLLYALAAASGVPVGDVVEVHRAALLMTSDGAA